MGAGGAGLASAEVSESVFLNPASLAHAPSFSSGWFYKDGFVKGENHTTDYGATFVDNSKDVFVPGAFSYIKRNRNFEGLAPADETYWQVAVGKFMHDQFSMGLTLYYLAIETDGKKYTRLNGDLGFMWNPSPNFGWGVVIYNLRKPDLETPDYLNYKPFAAIGLNFILTELVRVRMDIGQQLIDNPLGRHVIKAGLETFINRFVVLRLGGQFDRLVGTDETTLGLSFLGPRFSLDYAINYRQSDVSKGPLHSVDLRIPF